MIASVKRILPRRSGILKALVNARSMQASLREAAEPGYKGYGVERSDDERSGISRIVPPLASTLLRAVGVNACAAKVSDLLSSPSPRILTGASPRRIRPRSRRAAGVTSAP